MSMNLYLIAERTVIVEKTKKRTSQETEFDLFQTPTKVTNEVLELVTFEAQLNSYIKYVMSCTKEERENIYDEDDFMNDTPIGSKMYHSGLAHIAKLREFLVTAENEGYDVKFITI